MSIITISRRASSGKIRSGSARSITTRVLSGPMARRQILHNRDRLVVTPIVEDALEDVSVGVLRYRVEEIPCDDATALQDAGLFQPLRGPGDAGSSIENNALGLREGGKNGAQQNAVAAADIDDAAGS